MVKVFNSLKVFRAVTVAWICRTGIFVPTDRETDRQTDRLTDNYLASHILGKNSYKNGQTNTKSDNN